MPLHDPVAVYQARTNVEVQLLCHLLAQVGIEAHATEDLSTAGIWLGGTVPAMFNARVWLDREQASAAADVLRDYEQRQAGQRPASAGPDDGEPVVAVCEECGERSVFPAKERGSVQECPKCGAYVDVAVDSGDGPEDWSGDGAEDAEDTEEQ